jgi:hypothetical protein
VKALILRLFRFTRVRGLVVIVVGGFAGSYLLITGGLKALSGAGSALGFALSALVMIVVGASKYQRSASTSGQEEVLFGLLGSGRKFCLILRPFGQDAEMVLPKAMHKGRVGNGPFTRNVTMEQVITSAARTVLDMDTYGIVDQRTMLAPPGPILMRASNDEWQTVAQRLIRRAHAIVLILPPKREFADGFLWEIEQIRNHRARTRVIIVLAPSDQEQTDHQAALRRACVLLALLDGELDQFKVHEYELLLPDKALVLRPSIGGVHWWETRDEAVERTMLGRKRKVVIADMTYRDVLEEAMREIDHEHS